MKLVEVQNAIGMVLCHDITEIIPGVRKGRAFKKGHVIVEEDIPKLLSIGKEHIYIWEIDENNCHEDEAAIRIAKSLGDQGLYLTEPYEGKVELKASVNGLLKINIEGLLSINSIDEIAVATVLSNQLVKVNQTLAGCRIIPLVISNDKLIEVEKAAKSHYPIIEIKPLESRKIGVVTTGNEVFKGKIEDTFGPVIKQKIEALGSEVLKQIFVPDDKEKIADGIRQLIQAGAQMVVTTGGMSVDPDDVTPSGIRAAGGQIITYGTPVFPGAMFMLAEVSGIPVMGLPGCVMYHKTTVFDLIVPRLLAGEKVTKHDIIRLAHGGLCNTCEICRFPNCTFGKGF